MSNLRLAATVILARDGSNGLEIYLTRRSARSAFAPDAFVFPGGTIDPHDERAAARTLGLEPERTNAAFRARIPHELPTGEPAVDAAAAATLFVAALREVFEEAGILYARTAAGDSVPPSLVHEPGVQARRDDLRAGRSNFAEFLEERDWLADARPLEYFSHWITPPTEPRRYDTHFFFARAPQDQAASADAIETHDGVWIPPAQALQRYREGTMHLVYPTIKHLERLERFASVDEAYAFSRTKPILTIMPSGSPDDGFVMPAALEGAW